MQAAIEELDAEKAGKTAVAVLAYRSAAQAVTNGAAVSISFDAETMDTSAFHDLVTNPTRLTIPSGMGGLYQVAGQVMYDPPNAGGSSTGSERVASIRVNGVAIMNASVPANAYAPATALPYRLNAGDYVELIAYQDSTGSISTRVVSYPGTYLALTRVGD